MQASRRGGLSRTMAVAAVVVVLVVAAAASYFYFGQSSSKDKETLLLDFTPNLYHAPYYYGLDHGIYNASDIELTVQPGSSTTAAITAVSAGKADFALADAAGLVFARANSNITNVRIVAMIMRSNFYAVVYNKADISTIDGIQGKPGAAATAATSTETKLFYLLAANEGIDLNSTAITYGGASVVQSALLAGKADWSLNTVHNLPGLQALAAANGIQLGIFPFAQNGLDTYGEALITSTSMIQNHSDVVRRFVSATMQSLVDTVNDPASAMASLVKYQPQLNATIGVEGYKLDLSCCIANATGVAPLAFGWIDPTRMQSTVTTLVKGLGLSIAIDPTTLYTDQFTTQP